MPVGDVKLSYTIASPDRPLAGLAPLRESVTTTTAAAKKTADELAAAETALAAAKSELAAAPAQLEEARKKIAQSVVGQLQAAKERVDRLAAERKRLETSP